MATEEFYRLNQFLARCGYGSRRGVEKIIASGRVSIDGVVVDEPWHRVSRALEIYVGSKRVTLPELTACYLFYKPQGVVTTLSDPFASRDLAPYLSNLPKGCVPAGRLDADSEGLLVLSNDGALINSLTHPRYHLAKYYRVRVNRPLSHEIFDRFSNGIDLEEGRTHPARIRMGSDPRIAHIILYQGWKRQIRRMFIELGYHVEHLMRYQIGSMRLGNLEPGDIKEVVLSNTNTSAKHDFWPLFCQNNKK